MNDNLLQIVLTAKNLASGVIAEVGADVKALGASGAAASAQLSKSFDTVGSSLKKTGDAFLPFSIAAGTGLGIASKAAIDFNQQMEYLHTQAGLSQHDVEGLKDQVLALAPAVGQGPDKLAEAFYHIASAGNGIWDTSQMLDMLKLSAEGAAVGNASLDDTTYSLTSTMASNIRGAQTAAEAMGNLNAIVGAGDMRFQDLNGAISTGIMSTAATFGVDIRSMGTALATLTDNGEHADEASTRLRMTLALMAAPSTQAAKLLGDIGLQGPEVKAATESMTQALQAAHLTTTTLADDLRQPNGIMVALQDLKTHLQDAGLSADAANALLSKSFGGGRTDAAMLTMLQNLDRMDAKYKIIGENAGKFGDSWAAQQDTAAQKMKDFQAQLEVLGVKLGNAFLPTLEKLAESLGKVADWFSNLSPATQTLITNTLLFAAVLGPLAIGLGQVSTGIGAVLKLFGGAAGLIGSLGGAEAAAGGATAGIGALGTVLGALAPFAIAAAPIIAMVAFKLHDQAQSAKEVADNTANATDLINKNGAVVSLQTLFTQAQSRATREQKDATDALKTAQDSNKQSTENLTKANQDVFKAQGDVQDALKKYGQNSPQYQQAVQVLTDKETAYRDIVHDASEKTLDLMGAQGRLRDANNALKDATDTLNSYLREQNKDLGSITDTIHTFGPAADLQVRSIANLGQQIANVVAQFHSAQGDIQGGIASDIGNFQGLGSTIGRLQSAASNLQSTASGIKIQGGTTSSMQGNYGTAPVPGVYQAHADGGVFTTPHFGLVGEDGPEAIIPLNKPARAKEVMKEAGLSGGGVVVNMVNHIHNEVDMMKAMGDLAWQVRHA